MYLHYDCCWNEERVYKIRIFEYDSFNLNYASQPIHCFPSRISLQPFVASHLFPMGLFKTNSNNNFIVKLPKPLNPPEYIKAAKPVPEYIDPKDPLAVGIFYHEQNEFELSAYYFSISAARGDPTGLFLYAISMRHGWGMTKNETEAFDIVKSSYIAIKSNRMRLRR
jgi:hypothetical protein